MCKNIRSKDDKLFNPNCIGGDGEHFEPCNAKISENKKSYHC